MKNKTSTSLISGASFIIIGIILFLHPDEVVKFSSYIFGAILMLIGIYKCASYYIQDKKNGIVNRNELSFGITAIVLGFVFFFLADALELLLRFVVGSWIILSGIGKIMQTFYTTNRNNLYYSLFVVGIIYILIGLYIICVSNLALSIIGLFMIFYGVIDFISFFAYKNMPIKNKSIKYRSNNIEEAEIVEERIDNE